MIVKTPSPWRVLATQTSAAQTPSQTAYRTRLSKEAGLQICVIQITPSAGLLWNNAFRCPQHRLLI